MISGRFQVPIRLPPIDACSAKRKIWHHAMTPEEMQIYSRIIHEQLTLQDLQQLDPGEDALGVARRIKHQRRLLSQLWSVAHDLGKLSRLA
jgi:hypothetical protein